MKIILVFVLFIGLLLSCEQNNNSSSKYESDISQLKQKLDDIYKPGFGEIMGFIQHHHAKLWFAGRNENWDLASFEIHELTEGFDDVEKYQHKRKEAEIISMIKPSLDSVRKAVEEKNISQFKDSYKELTNTCNSCHIATNYEFIEIKVPDFQPYSNQVF